ncbi:MAG: ECF transporter S component [Oscillospiraceae bacterium]|nr:ECF transporter S component [Candidatus Equicaccousia limihippi]
MSKYRKLTVSGLCLAICIILPFFTGQIPVVGKMLSPMHLPVFLCGFLCGPVWGLAVGFIAPFLRTLIAGAPAFYPTAIAMAAELATYGAVCGLMYKILPKKIPYIYLSLIISMVAGRAVWGIMRFVLTGFNATEFPFSAFLAGAFINAVPGIIVQLIVIPLAVCSLTQTEWRAKS